MFDNALRTVEMRQMGFLLGHSWRGGMLLQLQMGCEDAVWSLQERSELGKPWGLSLVCIFGSQALGNILSFRHDAFRVILILKDCSRTVSRSRAL